MAAIQPIPSGMFIQCVIVWYILCAVFISVLLSFFFPVVVGVIVAIVSFGIVWFNAVLHAILEFFPILLYGIIGVLCMGVNLPILISKYASAFATGK